MKLILNEINIRETQFSEKTRIDNGILFINKEELKNILREDRRLRDVDIELARPGEKIRILQVVDAVEPRVKLDESNSYFPGLLSKVETAGQGVTIVLKGVAVILSEYIEEPEFPRDPNGEIIDMSGPGAELSIYGKTQNIVLLPYPANGVTRDEYKISAKIATLKTAVYLAQKAKNQKPDKIETYELELTPSKDMNHLPKIAYVFSILSTQHGIIPKDPILYGENITKIVPTILHPNEILDGALVSQYRAWGMETYLIQNHPIIKELYQRHGKELLFSGVILTVIFENDKENERSALMISNLAKLILGVKGLVLTKSGGGAPELIIAKIAKRCEEVGIKTAIAISHIPADIKDFEFGGITLFNFEEVDAIVSMGTPWEKITLPSMERVIGKSFNLSCEPPIGGEIHRMVRWIRGAQDQIGYTKLVVSQY
jgi:glycine reductase